MNTVESSSATEQPTASAYTSAAGRPSSCQTMRFGTSASVIVNDLPAGSKLQLLTIVNGTATSSTSTAAPWSLDSPP